MGKEMRLRMDFVSKVLGFDEKTRKVTFELIPNPERYEWKEISGNKVLYDKLDNVCFPEEVFWKGVENLKGVPIYYQPQLIKDSREYIKERIPRIVEELKGNFAKPTFEDKSEDFLESLEKDELGFVILSLDIVGSTQLATRLAPRKYKDIITVVLFEISSVIPLFHGYVLKYTGDGIIAYFPEPSFITKNDLSLDCSLTLRRLVCEGINPVLENFAYPKINIRIGLDSGDAYVVTIGNPSTKQHKDIIGKVVSLAAKIQSTADVNGISLGEVTFRNLHTDYRKLCVEGKLPTGWGYNKEDNNPYKIFKVNLS